MTTFRRAFIRRPTRVYRRRPRIRPLAVGAVVLLVIGVGAPVLRPLTDPDPAPRAGPPATGRLLAAPAPTGALDPARFEPGACVALGPSVGDRHRTVVLDAGHGGPDPGARGVTAEGRSVVEKDLALSVVLATAELLRARGYRVALSRTTDSAVVRLTPDDLADGALSTTGNHAQLLARARCANLAGADALISVHFNSVADSDAGGSATLYDTDRSFADANARLATAVQRTIEGALTDTGHRVTDRGVRPDTDTGGGEQTPQGETYGHPVILGPAAPGYVDEPSLVPGALVEPLFITNPAEATLAASTPGQQALARAVALGVEEFLQQP